MIHALPGMGADSRMYPDPWIGLPGFIAHDWPNYNGERTLPDLARTVCDRFAIRDDDSLIGASLGGMVACEITKIRNIRTLYLVGSAKQKEEVNFFLRALRPLADIAPIEWLRLAAGSVPWELAQMFHGTEASFIRAMCDAVSKWEGLGRSTVRCFRLHGRRDMVIPPPHDADLILDGGHLISMSHAKECSEFVRAKSGRSIG